MSEPTPVALRPGRSEARTALAAIGDADSLQRVREWCESKFQEERKLAHSSAWSAERALALCQVIAHIDSLKAEAES